MKIGDISRTISLVMRESFKSFLNNDDLSKAASMAFYSFLATIPLCLLVIVAAGQLIFSSEVAMQGLEAVVSQVSPVAAPVVLNEVTLLARHRTWGLLSIFILFWSVTPLASAMRSAFKDIFKVQQSLPFWATKLRDIASVLVLITLLLLLTLEKAYDAALTHCFQNLPFIMRILNATLPLLLAIGALWLFYYLLIHVRLRPRHWLVGSVVTLLLLALVGPLFALILRINPNYGFAFGSLKMVFILFIWVYYSFAAILFGTEVMANVWRRHALVFKQLLLDPQAVLKPSRLLDKFVRVCQANEVICREGEAGNEMFFILSGSVSLSKQDQPLLTMKTGDYFGEMAMLLHLPRTLTAVALAPNTTLAVIPRQSFNTILSENPDIMLAMLQEMASRLKITSES